MIATLLCSALAIGAPELEARQAEGAIFVDGHLGERGWQGADIGGDFVQKIPTEGAPASERTRLFATYDEDTLYLGIECRQAMETIVARLSRRDRPTEADRITIDLDTREDGRLAYHFEVNAAGVLSDALRFDREQSSGSDLVAEWDEIWDAAVETSTSGWSAELAIPFRILRFESKDDLAFALQVRRQVFTKGETDEWAPVPRDAGSEMQHYGHLRLSRLNTAAQGLELRPFALLEVEPSEGTSASAGLDAKWHVSEDATIDAAFLPDFGQIEADQALLNLSTFEAFLPERRPFFLEGLAAFETPLTLFYSRRIGRGVEAPALPESTIAPTRIRPVPIWGALKWVARPSSDWSVATLSAVTGPRELALAGGGQASAEPMAFSQIVRSTYDVSDGVTFGLLATALVRVEDESAHPSGPPGTESILCANGEARLPSARCTNDAYSAAADLKWRSADGDYRADAQLAATLLRGAAHPLSDGTIIRSGDAGPGLHLEIAKDGGSGIFSAVYQGFARRFDPNDLGYLERQNLHRFFVSAGLQDTTPGALFLDQRLQLEVFHRRNLDGLNLAEGYQVNHSGTFTDLWRYFAELHFRRRHFDDRELGDGRALERESLAGLELSIDSDPRRPIVLGLSSTSQLLFDGYSIAIEGSVRFNLLSQLELDILPVGVATDGEPRYAGLASDGAPVFGKLAATGLGATLRATYTFFPNLSLQAYGQLFVSWLDYHDFQRGPEGASQFSLGALTPSGPPAGASDANDATLNATIVLRWEYLPGSALFVVYTRAQTGAQIISSEAHAGLDLANLKGAEASDVVLAKLSYWWGI